MVKGRGELNLRLFWGYKYDTVKKSNCGPPELVGIFTSSLEINIPGGAAQTALLLVAPVHRHTETNVKIFMHNANS